MDCAHEFRFYAECGHTEERLEHFAICPAKGETILIELLPTIDHRAPMIAGLECCDSDSVQLGYFTGLCQFCTPDFNLGLAPAGLHADNVIIERRVQWSKAVRGWGEVITWLTDMKDKQAAEDARKRGLQVASRKVRWYDVFRRTFSEDIQAGETVNGILHIFAPGDPFYTVGNLCQSIDSTQLPADERCAICKAPFHEQILETVKLPCGHPYHVECIARSFVDWKEDSCPLCKSRYQFITEPDFAGPAYASYDSDWEGEEEDDDYMDLGYSNDHYGAVDMSTRHAMSLGEHIGVYEHV